MRFQITALLVLIIGTMASGCSPAQQPQDPAFVVQSFFDALNAGDFEGAMVFVADDANFIYPEVYSGKEAIGDHFEKEIVDRSANYELREFVVEGDTVRFISIYVSSVASEENAVEAVVEDGRIVFLIAD